MTTFRSWLVMGWAVILIAAAAVASFLVGIEEIGFSVAAMLFVAVGAFLMIRVPGNAIGAFLLLGGSAWLVYTVAGEYARYSIDSGGEALPLEYLAAWMGSWAGALLPVSIAALVVLFPDGAVSGRRRYLLVGLLIPLGLALWGALRIWGLPVEVLTDWETLDQDPAYVAIDLAFVIGFLLVLPAVAGLIRRFRNGDFIQRQQIKWFVLAAAFFGAAFLFVATSPEGTRAHDIAQFTMTIGIALLPISIGVAVVRYRLYDIDRIVSRTVSYALVAGALGAVYFGAVTLLTVFLPSNDPVVVAVSTLAAAALFNPVRRRTQRWVDRRFNRSGYDAEHVIGRLTGALREGTDADQVVAGWIDVVEETMEPAHLAVWVR